MYPNNDPAAFMTAFYGCLLAEVVPVPIEVPLTRKVSPVKSLRSQLAGLDTCWCSASSGLINALQTCVADVTDDLVCAGHWQPADRLPARQLRRDGGSDKRRLPQGAAQKSHRRDPTVQRSHTYLFT